MGEGGLSPPLPRRARVLWDAWPFFVAASANYCVGGRAYQGKTFTLPDSPDLRCVAQMSLVSFRVTPVAV